MFKNFADLIEDTVGGLHARVLELESSQRKLIQENEYLRQENLKLKEKKIIEFTVCSNTHFSSFDISL